MKKVQYQALDGCGFLLNKRCYKDTVGGRNSVSAGEILSCLITCLCHSASAEEVHEKKQFLSGICRQIWRDNCRTGILIGVFSADRVGVRGQVMVPTFSAKK